MPTSPAILALDQGTSSTRAIVFDISGRALATSQEELRQYYPQNGWVEHDADEIWQAQWRTARRAIDEAQCEISAIGITNQRETVVVWDRKSGQPIYKAIVWQDRRTAEVCQALRKAGYEAVIQQKSGLVLDPYFSASKIAWILDTVPGARTKAEKGELACGTIDSWLVYRLSDGALHITDVTNASRTSLMNINTLEWDEELLAIFKVPKALLPSIKSSAEVYGMCHCFGTAIPIAGLAGDQHAALFGQQCTEPGMLKCTYGTGAFLMSQCGSTRQDAEGLLSTIAWKIGNAPCQYVLEGAVFSAGSAVQWLRDGLKIIQHSRDIEALALTVKESQDVFFVPAFNGLGTPHWDPQARACLLGITRDTTQGHIARACLEAIAQQVCDIVDVIRRVQKLSILKVDGGACQNNLLMQIQANLGNLEVHRPQQTESTALGAAWLAAIGAGICRPSDCEGLMERSFQAEMLESQRDAQRQRWALAVKRSLGWAVE
jgi:glycerol kinase